MKRFVLCFALVFGGLLATAEDAHAAMLFGQSDFIAHIQDVDTPQGRMTLAYRYELTAFIVPLWLSSEEYVLVKVGESDGTYYPLGDRLDPQTQTSFGLEGACPAVPWSLTKLFAYAFVLLGWGAGILTLGRWITSQDPSPGRR